MEATLSHSIAAPSHSEVSRPAAARVAVATLFLINGALIATWVSRIPAIQVAHGLSHGTLGLALLAMAAGAVIAMPIIGTLTSRFGSDRLSQVAVVAYCALLPWLVVTRNEIAFFTILFVFGAAHGSLDVAMNAQAVAVAKRYPGPIMSSFHALFSTGGFVGAAAGGVLAGFGLEPLTHFALVAGVLGLAAFFACRHLVYASEERVRVSTAPVPITRKPRVFIGLLALGAVALCAMIGEGAMADWSAVYLRNVLQTTEGLAAAGYAAFSVAMLAGRWAGDWLTSRFRTVTLVRMGGAISATGLSLALLANQPACVFLGLTLVGAGFSTVVPIVFSAAGNRAGVSPGVALAFVTTMGYLGFLAGPPCIGFAAELVGLRSALALVIVTSALIVAFAPSVRLTSPTPGCDYPSSAASAARLRAWTRAGAGTSTEVIPAARAASSPSAVSSKTRHLRGSTPSRSAATRNGSGNGLPRA
jgi:predicted MFS family arabinose efflux permease